MEKEFECKPRCEFPKEDEGCFLEGGCCYDRKPVIHKICKYCCLCGSKIRPRVIVEKSKEELLDK